MEYKQHHFNTRAEWRKWLKDNHLSSPGIWFLFYKQLSGKKTISYNDAVEEALCYGWIDSIIKSIDDVKYMQKFTPRTNNNKWSPTNIERIKKLITEKKMTKAGMAKIPAEILKEGTEKKIKNHISDEALTSFLLKLKKHPIAFKNFNNLAPSYRKIYIGWIFSAKREETQQKRFNESVSLLEQNKKLGIK